MTKLRLASILLAAFSTSPKAAVLLNEVLNFDNNAVPSGWSLIDNSSGQHNVGIQNGVFYANQVDGSAILKRAYTPDPSASSLQISWEGAVFQTFWGNVQVLSLNNTSGDTWTVGAWSKNYNLGSGVRFFTTDANQEYGDVTGYNYQHGNFQSGNYNFSATFVDGLISFSGTLNGNLVFNFDTVVSGFRLHDQRTISFMVQETTGPTQWIDNVSLRETVTPVPLPAGGWLLVSACAGLFAMRRRLPSTFKP